MRRLAWGLTVLLLLGCAADPAPRDRFYRLARPMPERPAESASLRELWLAPPSAPGLYGERAMLFSRDPGRRILEQYHYRFWLQPPPELIRDYLATYLRRAGVARRVSTDYAPPSGASRLDLRIRRFEQVLGRPASEAVVGLELSWYAPDRDQPALQQAYEARAPIGPDGPDAVVLAFEQALGQVAASLVGDLVAARRARPSGE